MGSVADLARRRGAGAVRPGPPRSTGLAIRRLAARRSIGVYGRKRYSVIEL